MKRTGSIILSALILLLLCGCGNHADTKPETTETASASEATAVTAEVVVSASPASAPSELPSDAPTAEPSMLPEISEMPDAVNIADMSPVLTIPLYYSEEAPDNAKQGCLYKRNRYGDDELPVQIEGPKTCCIKDGNTLCVVDQIAGRIQLYDMASGEWIKSIDASAAEFDFYDNESSIAYFNGQFYLYSRDRGFILAIDEEGTVQQKIEAPLPIERNDPLSVEGNAVYSADLVVIDDELYLKANDLAATFSKDYVFRDGELIACDPAIGYSRTDDVIAINHNEQNWEIPTDKRILTGGYVLGTDEEGNVYVFMQKVLYGQDGKGRIDKSIRVYDRYSRLVAVNKYDVLDGKFDIFFHPEVMWKDASSVYVIVGTLEEIMVFELPYHNE